MYFIPIVLLVIFTIIEMWKGDKKSILFHIGFALLAVMLCFRYGQGTDYFGYMANYNLGDYHSEKGYVLLSLISKRCGISFEFFVFMISIFDMVCLYRVIQLYSPIKNLSLLLFYPTLYLTYNFSGLRQGIVIMFFLGFMLKWLQDGKWLKYLVACTILVTIHSSALVLIPLLIIKRTQVRWLYCLLLLATCVGLIIGFVPTEWFRFIRIGAVQYYLGQINVSLMGLAERIFMFAMVTWLVRSSNGEHANEQLDFLYKIYVFGFIISVMFLPWALLSSRLGAMMKATEIIIFPLLLKEDIRWKKIVMTFFIIYVLVMTTKNIWSYLQQGDYEGYNIFTYPYLTVFDKERAHTIRKEDYEGYLQCVEDYKNGLR